MQTQQMLSGSRTLGWLTVLAVGLALGTAVPALAQTEHASTIAACSAEEMVPLVESEWAAPPTQIRPGEPY